MFDEQLFPVISRDWRDWLKFSIMVGNGTVCCFGCLLFEPEIPQGLHPVPPLARVAVVTHM